MQLFTHIRLAHSFSDYPKRMLCVQARLQALSVLGNFFEWKFNVSDKMTFVINLLEQTIIVYFLWMRLSSRLHEEIFELLSNCYIWHICSFKYAEFIPSVFYSFNHFVSYEQHFLNFVMFIIFITYLTLLFNCLQCLLACDVSIGLTFCVRGKLGHTLTANYRSLSKIPELFFLCPVLSFTFIYHSVNSLFKVEGSI